jgi:hypothetical protein
VIEYFLYGLTAHVDQLVAEFRDPETPQERKTEIIRFLKGIYDILKETEKEI